MKNFSNKLLLVLALIAGFLVVDFSFSHFDILPASQLRGFSLAVLMIGVITLYFLSAFNSEEEV